MAEIKSHQFYQQSPLLQGRSGQEAIDRANETSSRRRMAEKLLESSSGFRRIDHPLQGVAQLAEAGIGAYLQNQADEKHAARQDQYNKDYSSIMGGFQDTPGVRTPEAGYPNFAAAKNVPGSIQKALEIGQRINNSDTFGMLNDLTMAQYQKEQAALEAAAVRKQDDDDYARNRADEIEDREWGAKNPDSGPPSSAMKNFARLQELQEEFPPIVGSDGVMRDSPEVLRFIDFVRKSNLLDIGGSVVAYDPTNPDKPTAVAEKTLRPGDTPETKAKQQAAGAVGKATGESNYEQYKVASAAIDQQRKNNSLIEHLNTSDATTGMGAEFINNINRVKSFFGNLIATNKVEDTEILNVMMGSEVFPLIQSLGIGSRGMDTPAEREFMRSVLTGQIQLNKQTLLRMASMRFKDSSDKIRTWNKRVESGELDDFFLHSGITKGPLESLPAIEPVTKRVVDPPPDATVPIEQMDAVQLNNALRGATPEQRAKIGNRLTELGY